MTKFINYMMSRGCLFIFLLAMVPHAGVTLVSAQKVCDYNSRPHDRGLCGSNLADALSLLCGAINNQPHLRNIVKRQTDKFLDDTLRSIMLNKKDALSYLAKRGGIVCECCYNYCRYTELIQYCELPPYILNRSPINN